MNQVSGPILAFAGDLALGGPLVSAVRPPGASAHYHFRKIQPLLEDVDVMVVNLEGPIGRNGQARPGVYALIYSDADLLDWLASFPVTVCNLANNHMMDFGPEALSRTVQLLRSRGIHCVGAGMDATEAERELIIESKGMRFGFISATTNERHVGSVLATAGTPGSAGLVPDLFVEKVQSLSQRVDATIATLHWGFEYFDYPAPDQVRFCRSLAEAGASLVVGHHPHVAQPIETFDQSIIAYSLGNFLLPPMPAADGRMQFRKPATRNFTLLKSNTLFGKSRSYHVIRGSWSESYELLPHTTPEKCFKLPEIKSYAEFWNGYHNRRTLQLKLQRWTDRIRKSTAVLRAVLQGRCRSRFALPKENSSVKFLKL